MATQLTHECGYFPFRSQPLKIDKNRRPVVPQSWGETMKLGKLRDWLEILGIFSLVASLVFVGLQLRQTQKISISQTYQARTATAAEHNMTMASNPIALSAYMKATNADVGDMTPEEYESLRRITIAVMYLYDNAHFQYQQGFVSEEFWTVTRENMKALMSNPIMNEMVMDRLPIQGRPEFRAVVLEVNEELLGLSEN